MSRKNQLMLAVLAIDPDAYGDYKAVDGVMSYTYHASGGAAILMVPMRNGGPRGIRARASVRS